MRTFARGGVVFLRRSFESVGVGDAVILSTPRTLSHAVASLRHEETHDPDPLASTLCFSQ